MPRLWSDSIDAHRREVRRRILSRTVELVADGGVLTVTMSQVARAVGITRATLYKYFAGIEEILDQWHADMIEHHLDELRRVAAADQPVHDRLRGVLEGYASIRRHQAVVEGRQHGAELSAFAHRDGGQTGHARHRLLQLVADLVDEAIAAGVVTAPAPSREQASFCLYALDAASVVTTDQGVDRLVDLVYTALTGRMSTEFPSP